MQYLIIKDINASDPVTLLAIRLDNFYWEKKVGFSKLSQVLYLNSSSLRIIQVTFNAFFCASVLTVLWLPSPAF